VAIGALLGCAPKGYIFVVPSGYEGWVAVEFGVPYAPPLPEESGFQVITVPLKGRLSTSSALRTSPTRNLYYVTEGGARQLTTAGHIAGFTKQDKVSVGTERLTLFLYFGTKEAFERHGRRRDDQGRPIPGHVSSAGEWSAPTNRGS
jgi:hypothetical protein